MAAPLKRMESITIANKTLAMVWPRLSQIVAIPKYHRYSKAPNYHSQRRRSPVGAQIFLRSLDRRVPEQELDLLQIPAALPTQFRASPVEVVSAEVLDADLLG